MSTYTRAIQEMTCRLESMYSRANFSSKIIVINGFSRSGTSWLSHLVCNAFRFREVFEILDVAFNYAIAYDYFQPIKSSDDRWNYQVNLESKFFRALSQNTLPRFSRKDRQAFRNRSGKQLLYPPQWCFKLCNGHNLIGHLEIPTIHIVRKTASTIDSIANSYGWGKSLLTLDHHKAWTESNPNTEIPDELVRFLRGNDNYVSLAALQAALDISTIMGRGNKLIVEYEKMKEQPIEQLQSISQYLDILPVINLEEANYTAPSGTTVINRSKTSFSQAQTESFQIIDSFVASALLANLPLSAGSKPKLKREP